MVTNKELTRNAIEYQKFTTIAHEIHARIIRVFTPVFSCHDEYISMPYNFPALKDTIEDLVYTGYRRTIFQVDIEMNERMHVEVELTFCFDGVKRNFTIFEHDFKETL